ncbi:hypothetical protein SBA6_40052 [Candidatus Sulfopaludibacter sp. SbA6]|nr:hypothetical protein SBA6_40052 [Candidatus Sulfopaludibacter sp. SbA6]
MRIRIIRWTGSESDGIVLSTCGSIIRAAIPGCDDAVEFSYRGAHWFWEDVEPVELEFPTAENSDRNSASDLNEGLASRCLGSDSRRTHAAAWVN